MTDERDAKSKTQQEQQIKRYIRNKPQTAVHFPESLSIVGWLHESRRYKCCQQFSRMALLTIQITVQGGRFLTN